mgnify:CR=1 FL=1
MQENSIGRVTMTFMRDNPEHEAAWEIIQGIPKGKRTGYICACIAERERMDLLAEMICQKISTIRRPPPPIKSEIINQPNQTGEAEKVKNNLLGFLSALESKGDDEPDPLF